MKHSLRRLAVVLTALYWISGFVLAITSAALEPQSGWSASLLIVMGALCWVIYTAALGYPSVQGLQAEIHEYCQLRLPNHVGDRDGDQ
jgi:hypothetical protein